MDVIEIPKMNKFYRVLYDVKKRFTMVKIKAKEAEFKLCKIQKKFIGPNKTCYFVTHDGRTLKYINPEIGMNDTVKLNLLQNKVEDFFKLQVGNTVFCLHGNNRGRVGVCVHITKFDGQHDLITVKDAHGHSFTTRTSYVMAIGKGNSSEITLPKEKGLKMTIVEEKEEKAGH